MKSVGRVLAVGWLCCAGVAWAGPGELEERDAAGPSSSSISEEPLRILDVARAAACRVGICFSPGARTTILVESTPVVAARPSVAAPPRFSRAASLAANAKEPIRAETASAWTLDLAAQLKRPAVAGNTIFLFFDLDDPDALKNRHMTALYQAAAKAGARLAAHLSLSPEDGFRGGHTYRLKIVQLLGGREVLLAESDFTLL